MSQCGLPNGADRNSPHAEAFVMNFGSLENFTRHLLKSSLVSRPSRRFRSWRGFSTASCLFFHTRRLVTTSGGSPYTVLSVVTCRYSQKDTIKATYVYFSDPHFKLRRTSSAACASISNSSVNLYHTVQQQVRLSLPHDDAHTLPAASWWHWLRLVLRCLAGSQMKDLWSFLSDVATPHRFNQLQRIKYKMSHFAFL